MNALNKELDGRPPSSIATLPRRLTFSEQEEEMRMPYFSLVVGFVFLFVCTLFEIAARGL